MISPMELCNSVLAWLSSVEVTNGALLTIVGSVVLLFFSIGRSWGKLCEWERMSEQNRLNIHSLDNIHANAIKQQEYEADQKRQEAVQEAIHKERKKAEEEIQKILKSWEGEAAKDQKAFEAALKRSKEEAKTEGYKEGFRKGERNYVDAVVAEIIQEKLVEYDLDKQCGIISLRWVAPSVDMGTTDFTRILKDLVHKWAIRHSSHFTKNVKV